MIVVNITLTRINGSEYRGTNISEGMEIQGICASFWISKLEAKNEIIGMSTIKMQPIPRHTG